LRGFVPIVPAEQTEDSMLIESKRRLPLILSRIGGIFLTFSCFSEGILLYGKNKGKGYQIQKIRYPFPFVKAKAILPKQ
jgi:hypothetical protein